MSNQKIDTRARIGFGRSDVDHCVYFKRVNDHILNIVLYVDNMLIIPDNKSLFLELKTRLCSKFEMKNIEVAKYIVSMEMYKDRSIGNYG